MRLEVFSVSVPAWVGIAFSRFRLLLRLSCFVGSLWVCLFLWGDPDGGRPGSGLFLVFLYEKERHAG